MAINREWHQANRMPKKATLEQCIARHKAHSEHCHCRETAASIGAEIERPASG